MNILIPKLPDKYLPKRPTLYKDESSNESSNESKPTSFFKQLRKREEKGTPIWAFTNNIFLSCNENNQIIFTRVFSKKTNLEKLIENLNETKKNIFVLKIKNNQLFYEEYTNFLIKESSPEFVKKNPSNITGIEQLHENYILGNYIKQNNNIIKEHKSIIGDNIDFTDFLFYDKNGNYVYIEYIPLIWRSSITNDFFKLFKKIYGKQLKLELYKDFYITSLEDAKNFKHEFTSKPEHSAYYPIRLTTGGKKILKKY